MAILAEHRANRSGPAPCDFHGEHVTRLWGRRMFASVLTAAWLTVSSASPFLAVTLLIMPRAHAQDLTQFLDLASDDFTKADVTRADIEALIAKRQPGERIDLSARRLNKLDLSGIDLSNANLQSARINGTNLAKANLEGAVLDQAWDSTPT